jgi:hypothetical protein
VNLPPVWLVGREGQEDVIEQQRPKELGRGNYFTMPDGSLRCAWHRPRGRDAQGRKMRKVLKKIRHKPLKVSRQP